MAEIIISKRCSKCKKIQPVSEFYKNKNRKDGLRCWCKACFNAAQRAYKQTPAGKEAQRRSNRKYTATEHGKTMNKKHTAYNRKKYPDKIKARRAVTRAIKAGKLPPAKTSQCVYCGKQAALWHHWAGYEKEHWLDVIPLCAECDYKAHKKIAS